MEHLNETLEMLEDLTEEELQELNDIFDPENNLLPIHERMSYQCSKQPSRQFNKDQLSKHLETALNFGIKRVNPVPKPLDKEAVESTIGKDYLPFVKKEKDYSNHTLNLPTLRSVPRARSPSPLPDLTKEELECIENATEDELVEVAAMLKMNELVTAEQVESVQHGRKPSGTGILRPTLVKTQYPIQKSFSIDDDDDIEEYVDVDAMVKALRSKGEDISIIVCNNQPYMDPEVLEEIAAHLLANKNIRHLSLANCNVTDSVIDSFAEALETNTKLETLNLESNFVTPVGVKKLMDAIQDSKTLREIRLENQYSKIGPKCEAQMTECVSKNYTLLNFGYSFETRGPRDAMNRYILRNNDLLRNARKQGGKFYNLAEQKRLIAKFKPPWIMRRPKRKGPDAEMFEGRKIIMKGSSKKKKKKGAALVNEMLDKAAQVSKRWENKERTGELHSEYARIEEQSKKNMEEDKRKAMEDEIKHVAEHGDRRRGRRRNKEAEDEKEDEALFNGEAARQKGQKGVNGEVEGMGAANRRRGRGGGNEDDDDDGSGDGRRRRSAEDEDAEDGGSGRRRMDKETRMKAMKGGKVVDDEKVGMGNMTRRKKEKTDYDDDDDDDKNNDHDDDDDDTEEIPAKIKEDAKPSSKQKLPVAKTIGSQPVGGLDSLSMRNRRKNKVIHDEEEDLDTLLNSVSDSSNNTNNANVTQDKDKAKTEESSIRRRKKNQQEDEESLDDLLNSVQKIEKKDDNEDRNKEDVEEDETDKGGKVKVPSGKTIGSQPVAKLESLSLRGRRKKVDYEDEESVDDLLKSVKATDAKEQQKEEQKDNEEMDDGKDDDDVKGSKAKLPTGRKVGSQKVAELESLSIRDRRKKKAYNDEDEEDIDALLSSVSSDSQQSKKAMEDNSADKGPRLPAGKKLTEQPVGDLGNLSFRDRRKQKLQEEEDSGIKQSPKEAEDDNEASETKMAEENKTVDPRVPSGKAIAKDNVIGLETLSFAERRRRKRLGLDDDAPASVAAVEEKKDAGENKQDDAELRKQSAAEGKEDVKDTAKQEKDTAENRDDNAGRNAARDRRRRRAQDDDDNEEDAEKKRESRRSSRQSVDDTKQVEKPKEPEKPKEEPKKEPAVVKPPEKPVIDFSKPMTLRERRRLKEQGLL